MMVRCDITEEHPEEDWWYEGIMLSALNRIINHCKWILPVGTTYIYDFALAYKKKWA